MSFLQFLGVFARHGRLVLVVGLLFGIFLPELAHYLKDWLPQMITALLFIAALRIGPREAVGNLTDLRETLSLVGIYQLLIPILLCIVAITFGISNPLMLGLILMTAASSISGSPNLTLMSGHDPAPALRLLVVGTALLPLTVVPVFWLAPSFGSTSTVFYSAFKLLIIIAAAATIAFAIRHFFMRNITNEGLRALDGVSAIAMAVVVVGLMSAIGPALRDNPSTLILTLVVACVANFGLQFLTWATLKNRIDASKRVAYSIVSGNRNTALFLAALPATVTDPILLFIGCYQVPMYLTPLVLDRLYTKRQAD